MKLFVVAKIAQTLDGKTATSSGQSKWITSTAARASARKIRDSFDAILVGINTVLKDNPQLTGVHNKKLIKVVVDSSLRTPLRARVIKDSANQVLIATTVKGSIKKESSLEKVGVEVLQCRAKNGEVDLRDLFRRLAKIGIKRLLIEGGAETIGSALKDNLVDQMHIYIAPKLMGDSAARGAIAGLRALDVNRLMQLKNIKIQRIGPDIRIEGNVHGHH